MKPRQAAQQIGIPPERLRQITRGIVLPSQVHRPAGKWRRFAPIDLLYVRLVDELIRFKHSTRVAHVNAGAILGDLFAPGASPSAATILRRSKGIVIRFTNTGASVPSLSLLGVAQEVLTP